MMTFYQKEVIRIQRDHYSNKKQIDTAIGTRRFIINHLDKELNLALLAQVHLTSKFHLLRLFKKYYGQTPKQYLIEMRIERAKGLLKKGVTVTTACFDVGFESPCSFSTLFKTRTGQTPTEYRKEQLSQS